MKKSWSEIIGSLCGSIANYFISAIFIWWGWNILAPHLNAPIFSYWEVFAIRMAFSYTMSIFWQKRDCGGSLKGNESNPKEN